MFETDQWMKIIGLIAAVLGIPIAIFTIIDRVNKGNPDLSDLFVSQLELPDRLQPLDGYPIINVNEKMIFTGGFTANFTFSHNSKGEHSIVITGMKLILNSFDPIEIPEYAYEIESSSVIGAGTVKPNIFALSLNGSKVGYATKSVDNKSIKSLSSNFFDTTPAEKIALKPSNDYPEEVQVKVSTWANGLYKVHFSVDYHVAGEDRHKITEPILIYYWEI